MLKQIHKHQKITIVVLFLLACTMLLFGVDLSNRGEEYAIKVNDTEISYPQYAKEKERFSASLQQQYGDAFKFIINNPSFNIDEKLKEKLIPQILIKQKAREDNLSVSDEVLQQNILKLFSNGNYENYLKYSGQSARAFEADLRGDLINQQLVGFVTTMSKASEQEAKAQWENEHKQYTINYIAIAKDSLKGNIAKPTDEVLKEIYEEEASTFEKEQRIKYNYIVLDAKDATKLVEVLEEDVELYYSENEDKYRAPKTATYDVVTLKAKASTEPEKLKVEAETILGEAIAKDNLDDISSKSNSLFDISISKNQQIKGGSDKIAKSIFKLTEPGFTNLIEDNNEYKIVKVNYFVEGAVKGIDEVRDVITNIIKVREAPAYLAIYGEDLYNELSESKLDLKAFAKNKGLKIDSTELVGVSISPPALNSLSERVYEQKEEKIQLIELGDKVVLVEVLEHKEREIPELKDVKEKLVKIYEKQELERLLKDKEDEVKEALQSKEAEDLTEFAKLIKAKVETKDKVNKLSGLPVEIVTPEISKAVFNTKEAPKFIKSVYNSGKSIILAEISSIKAANPETFTKVKSEYIKRSSNDNSELILASLINKLKAKSEIVVRN